MPWLHRRLTLRSPSGTLGMGVATWVTMRVVVTTPLAVTPSLASEMEPPPLPRTPTCTLLWSGTLVMGLTRLSAWWKESDDSSDRWMTFHTCQRRCKPPSTHKPAWCTSSSVTSRLTLMLEGAVGCPGMTPHLSLFIPNFSSYLITCLAHWSYHCHCHDCQ
jgi:hypothetical protein